MVRGALIHLHSDDRGKSPVARRGSTNGEAKAVSQAASTAESSQSFSTARAIAVKPGMTTSVRVVSDEAGTLSAPREGMSSAPIPRRKLRQTASKAHSSTPRGQRTESRGEGRQWRDRLASSKALLGVGTEDACEEALELMLKFMTAAPEAPTALDGMVCSRSVGSVALMSESSETTPNCIGEIELRSCAQCIVLLLRVTSKEMLLRCKLDPTGLLVRSLELCQTGSQMPMLKQLMVASGILGVIVPLLSTTQSNNAAETALLLKPSLCAIVSLSHMMSEQAAEQARGLIEALLPLITEPMPIWASELAVQAIKNMSRDDVLRGIVAESGAVAVLVSVCCGSSARAPVAGEAARALGSLAVDNAFESTIVEHGGVQALLHLLCTDNLSSSVADAAYEALANLIDCAEARHILASKGGIKPIVATICSGSEQQRKAAGWLLVSLSVDPELGETVVAQGGLPGLMEYVRSGDLRLQEEAAWALANLSALSPNASPMAQAGVHHTLIDMLKRAPELKVMMQVVWTLANLAVNDALKRTLGQAGAVPALLDQLDACITWNAESKETDVANNAMVQTARAIANLAIEASNRPRILAADGVRRLLDASTHTVLAEVVARALVNLSHDASVVQSLVQAGGINAILQLIRSDRPKVQHEAVVMALNIASRQAGALVVEPVFETLICVIESPNGSSMVQEHAAQVLWSLAKLSEQAKMVMISAGVLRRLCRLDLSTSSEDLRAACSGVVGALGSVLTPSSRRALLQASLLPQDVHPNVSRRCARKANQHRKPSPLSVSSTVPSSHPRQPSPLSVSSAAQPAQPTGE